MTTPGPDEYDVVVIGGGPPGENAADYAGRGGLSVALVEKELVGGECSYWACMPSKALLRPVETLHLAEAMPGVQVQRGLQVDAVLARRDSFTHGLDDSSQVQWAQGAGIDVVRGHGRLAGERQVAVRAADGSERLLRARHAVVVATGSTAQVPPIPGLAEAQPWLSRDVTNLHEVPARVAVIGGGVVACEAATWLNGLGSAVTLLVVGDRLLARNEPFAGELVGASLRERGVDVRLGVAIRSVRRPGVRPGARGRVRGGEVTVALDGGEVAADELLVAAGRRPGSEDIGLETVGVEPGGALHTDDTMQVTGVAGGWLFAVGDVTGRALLTHMGKYQARVCGDVIAARAAGRATDGPRFRSTSDHGKVPQVTFTDPQVASVGVTEAEARAGGHPVRTVEYDMAAVAGASLLRDDYRGRAKLVVDTASQTLLGATFVGPEVAELVHAATVAMVGGVTLDELWHAVPSYPTVSEIWLRLLETWRSESP